MTGVSAGEAGSGPSRLRNGPKKSEVPHERDFWYRTPLRSYSSLRSSSFTTLAGTGM